MRIGLTGGAPAPEQIIEQAVRAEAEGFSSLWYASTVQGDPLVSMALAGRATSTIELGTAVLQTYPCHPLLQAQRAASVAAAMGRAGFTLGVGPSHQPIVEGAYGLSYARPGRNTEEYLTILSALLGGAAVDFHGEDWNACAPTPLPLAHPVPVLLSALSPRLLRVAAERAAGVVLWMAPAAAIEHHIAPTLTAAAKAAGRSAPRIVAGLPIAVHDDVAEARQAVTARATVYEGFANYRRIMTKGGASSPADAAIVGDEASVETQLWELLATGATDVWASIVPVGPDPAASADRTRNLLRSLIA